RRGGLFSPISREGSLVLNNIVLTTACATVLIGTLYPLALEALTGEKISVGPPYFNATFVPLMVPLFLALPFGPLLAWKRGDVAAAGGRLMWALLLALLAFACSGAFVERGPWLAPFGVALGIWAMAGAISEFVFRANPRGERWDVALRRVKNLPRSVFGTTLAHFGVGMMVIGVVATTAWRQESVLVMKPGAKTELAGYTLTFEGAKPERGPNYSEQVGVFRVSQNGQLVTTLAPAKRVYDAPPQPTSEAGIHASWGGDLYAVLGDAQLAGGYAVRLYFHPFVRCIWIGALIMFLGGFVSLTDRRLRVGAPRRAGVAAQPVAAE
ncbi:MAG: heme lyase NrfEFG subunit NrfE, partial [Alphaproteobacteria bacterium]|nr:heme lyase NrfEFG subunit NrfE [Alphaproteobacteria bacterium]